MYRAKSRTTMHWVSCHNGSLVQLFLKFEEFVCYFYHCDESLLIVTFLTDFVGLLLFLKVYAV